MSEMGLLISATHKLVSLPLSLSLVNSTTFHLVALAKNLNIIYDFFLIPYKSFISKLHWINPQNISISDHVSSSRPTALVQPITVPCLDTCNNLTGFPVSLLTQPINHAAGKVIF